MNFALVGNPNVGKSLIFNQLTGLGVEVSNFPGTTLAVQRGSTCFRNERLEICDLPGVYTIEGTSQEEQLVRSRLESGDIETVIAVIDASHLERNLYLLLQLAEYGRPMVVVLNMIDEAEEKGLSIDCNRLAGILGVEVIPTVANVGKNIDRIIPAAREQARAARIVIPYDEHIEGAVRALSDSFGEDRAHLLSALSGGPAEPDLADTAEALEAEIFRLHRMTAAQIIAINRHNCASVITGKVVSTHEAGKRFDIDRYLSTAFPGIPLLAIFMAVILIVVFAIGSWLESIIVAGFTTFLYPPLAAVAMPELARQLAMSLLLALEAGLGIAFPFIFLFYLFISVLEDSGYLTRAAFLADRAMHRLGMHGQAIIPLVLGFGCNVPAVMSLRLLSTRRERTIASFLVTMIPCSARAVVIAGVLAAFVGIAAALSVYVVIGVLIVATGIFLSRVTPGERFGMILELSPLRRPRAGAVLKKSWRRIKEFLGIAMPLLFASSVALGLLEYFGAVQAFEQWLTPFSTTVLGLPGYVTTALLFGTLRKEMALGTLVVLAGTPQLNDVLSAVQLYVFALVSVLFIPCISTIAVLRREVGGRITLLVCVYTLGLGIAIGALIHFLAK